MKNIIRSQNRYVLNKNRNTMDNDEPGCGCKNKYTCKIKCKIKNVIYRASAISDGDQKIYIHCKVYKVKKAMEQSKALVKNRKYYLLTNQKDY